jgi:hypothetical protein
MVAEQRYFWEKCTGFLDSVFIYLCLFLKRWNHYLPKVVQMLKVVAEMLEVVALERWIAHGQRERYLS